eukprot:364100-Chlamydomonas_euryale.AAC.28
MFKESRPVQAVAYLGRSGLQWQAMCPAARECCRHRSRTADSRMLPSQPYAHAVSIPEYTRSSVRPPFCACMHGQIHAYTQLGTRLMHVLVKFRSVLELAAGTQTCDGV